MMLNKVVIRYRDGRILKGFTADFRPDVQVFHVTTSNAPGSKPESVKLADLKAMFFVKDLVGRADRDDTKEFDAARSAGGRKMRVVFSDGEEIVGVTQGYQPDRPGFFLVPADPGSNNLRCFVVSAALREVTFL